MTLARYLLPTLLMAVIACGGTTPLTQTVSPPDEPPVIVSPERTPTVAPPSPTTTPVLPATATPTPIATAAGVIPVVPPSPLTVVDEAIIAVVSVGDENGYNQAQSPDNLKNLGLAETLFLRNPADDSTEPWLAKSWTITSDLRSATVEIDTRAEFQWLNDSGAVQSFGFISADDVAWSMNVANALTNPESRHGQAGDFAGLWSEWRVVDIDTVEFDFVSFDSTWNADYTNESGQALSIFSRKVIDELGADFARNNVVSTGVYLVEEWSRNVKRTQVSVTAASGSPHWKFTAKTDRVTMIEVPEATTRVALLTLGEVDIAAIDARDVSQFTQGGFLTTSTGGAIQVGIFFAGNLWEENSAKDGLPLIRDTYGQDLAWIGDPADPEDMEEARSVRNALARSIDRDAINENLLAGLGRPVEVEYVSTAHSRWQDKWNYGYDPDLAGEILRGENSTWPINSDGVANYLRDEAGGSRQDQLNGNGFSVSIYAGPELQGGQGLGGEIVDAVARYWSDLGLQVATLKFPYATFRPTLVARTNTHPWVTACDKGRESNPWHFPKGLVQTSLTRGGFGCGFESPFILDSYVKQATEPDENARNQLVDAYVQYVYDEALQPGIVAVPELWVMNPIKVKSWDMGKLAAGAMGRVWELELR